MCNVECVLICFHSLQCILLSWFNVERRVSTFIELRFTVIRVISPLSPH